MRKGWRLVWKARPLCIFWMVWKARNDVVFGNEVLSIQKLKIFFVNLLWSETKLSIEVVQRPWFISLIGLGIIEGEYFVVPFPPFVDVFCKGIRFLFLVLLEPLLSRISCVFCNCWLMALISCMVLALGESKTFR